MFRNMSGTEGLVSQFTGNNNDDYKSDDPAPIDRDN